MLLLSPLQINRVKTEPSAWSPSYSLPASGAVSANIATNQPQDVKPAIMNVSQWNDSTFLGNFGGGAFVEGYSQGGAFVIANSGGHSVPANVGALIFDFETAAFSRKDPPASQGGTTYYRGGDYSAAELTGDPYYEITGSNGIPSPAHNGQAVCVLPTSLGGGPKGSVVTVGRQSVTTTATIHPRTCHRMDLESGEWSRLGASEIPVGHTHSSGATAVLDAARARYWRMHMNTTSKQQPYFDIDTQTWLLTTASTNFPSAHASSGYMFMHAGILIRHSNSNGLLYGYNPDAPATGWVQLNVSGALPGEGIGVPWEYFPLTGKYYKVLNAGGTTVYRLQAPASSPMTNTWVADSITLSGSLPAAAFGYHNRFFHVPAIQRMAWIPGGTTSGVYLCYPT